MIGCIVNEQESRYGGTRAEAKPPDIGPGYRASR